MGASTGYADAFPRYSGSASLAVPGAIASGKMSSGGVYYPSLLASGTTNKTLNAASVVYAFRVPFPTADRFTGVQFRNSLIAVGKNARVWFGLLTAAGAPGPIHWIGATTMDVVGEKPILWGAGTWLVPTLRSGSVLAPPIGSDGYLAIETDATTCQVTAVGSTNYRPLPTTDPTDSTTTTGYWTGSHVYANAIVAGDTFGTATRVNASTPLVGLIVE